MARPKGVPISFSMRFALSWLRFTHNDILINVLTVDAIRSDIEIKESKLKKRMYPLE